RNVHRQEQSGLVRWSGQAGRVRNHRADKTQRSRQSIVKRAGSGTIRQTRYQRSSWRVVRNSRGQDRRSSFRVRIKQCQDQAGSRQDAGTGAHGKHTPRP
ncbi:unnamed protein product, partial [Staurois parvus]